jgi:RNA polymerase sigma-70 factor, ECF subfamily
MSIEQELLQRAQDYEQSALGEIYDTYSPGIYRYAVRLLGDQDLAEDCVAETFSRFLAALKKGKGPDRYLQSYLYRIAHNWITDHYRSQPVVIQSLDQEMLSSDEPDLLDTVAINNEQENVRNALARLTADQRQVILLKYMEELSNEAIASALGKPIGAVKSLQHRAINSLKRFLMKEKVT